MSKKDVWSRAGEILRITEGKSPAEVERALADYAEWKEEAIALRSENKDLRERMSKDQGELKKHQEARRHGTHLRNKPVTAEQAAAELASNLPPGPADVIKFDAGLMAIWKARDNESHICIAKSGVKWHYMECWAPIASILRVISNQETATAGGLGL